MYLVCHHCGEKQWLDTRRTCEVCGTTLRRCLDCKNYYRPSEKCQAMGCEVEVHEAEHPTALAVSSLCQRYSPMPTVLRANV